MSSLFTDPPVLGLAAWSGTGKTTLLVQLLPRLRAAGLRIGMIKHAHHSFDVDIPGKDSYELRKAGAEQMLVASQRRWALMRELDPPREPVLTELLARLDREKLDLILVEGFRAASFAKIELHRPSMGKPALHLQDDSIIAVASDAPLSTALPILDLNRPDEIAAFVLAWSRQIP
ncbi:MAG: molybdopterin-guanine dinucleotide biosynthesis protein MobB [Gammaproteobacteria bacterium]|jgi:molybdopterin-guanine dinucleotide biosynthesis protein MobB